MGRELVAQLSADPRYEHITLLSRRPIESASPKVHLEIIDFDQPASWHSKVVGDVLFSCLGTTLRVAGSKDAQFRVDHDYQLWAARAAAKNGVLNYVLVSSTGADPNALVFYSRMKGQLEMAVKGLGFSSCNLLRPGILDGDREQSRPGEQLALGLLRRVPSWALPKSARPSPVQAVARTCILADHAGRPGTRIIEAGEILEAS